MSFEKKLQEMGITLPEPPKPVAAYVPGVKVDKYIYTAGQIPFVGGELKYKGKAGKEVSVEEAYEAVSYGTMTPAAAAKDVVEKIKNYLATQ